jgi:hypothetical protein
MEWSPNQEEWNDTDGNLKTKVRNIQMEGQDC